MKSDTKSSVAYPPPGSATPDNNGLFKVVVGLQLLITIGGFLATGDSWDSASAIIAMSLAMLLFSRERVHDERVEHLKLKAISYGLAASLLTASLLNTGSKMLKMSSPRLTLSAIEGLILILVIALSLFHYWRWQDGREKA
jgi:hypothetical protein